MWRDGNGPSGQMTSPNFSMGKYPNSFHDSKIIKVDKEAGMAITKAAIDQIYKPCIEAVKVRSLKIKRFIE